MNPSDGEGDRSKGENGGDPDASSEICPARRVSKSVIQNLFYPAFLGAFIYSFVSSLTQLSPIAFFLILLSILLFTALYLETEMTDEESYSPKFLIGDIGEIVFMVGAFSVLELFKPGFLDGVRLLFGTETWLDVEHLQIGTFFGLLAVVIAISLMWKLGQSALLRLRITGIVGPGRLLYLHWPTGPTFIFAFLGIACIQFFGGVCITERASSDLLKEVFAWMGIAGLAYVVIDKWRVILLASGEAEQR